MFFIVAILLGVVTVPLAGGQIRRLGYIQFRWPGALIGALGLQILIISILHRNETLDRPLHLVSYLLSAAFVVANLRIPGLWMIATGGLMNAVVIFANGGVMAASRSAFRIAGVHINSDRFSNSQILAHPKLAFLGDNWAIPSWLPFATTLSIGDVLIALGAIVLIHGVCGSRLFPSWLQAPGFEPVEFEPLPATS